MYFMTVKLGSAFRTFLDPDPYSEYGCGSRQVKNKLKAKGEILKF